MDGGVSKQCFGVSKLGWWCFEMDGGVETVFWCFETVFRYFESGVSKQCFEMDGGVSKRGWWCFGVSGGVSKQCFEMDGGVSVFRNGVSKWMVVFRCFERCFGRVFRSGWWCFETVFRYFEMDGGVSRLYTKFHNSDYPTQ